jgi:anaerobic ribonucleoside-triphosphate reductase activating protein
MATKKVSLRLGLHGIVPRTTTNGPGTRYGIWVQGCKRVCPGCVNPNTLPPLSTDAPDFVPPSTPGWIDVHTLLGWIRDENLKERIDGISVSGGEPFDQVDALHDLLIGTQRLGLNAVVFTGHVKEELMGKPDTRKFFLPTPAMDILVDGAYDRGHAVEGELRGSSNQRVILLTSRYKQDDIFPSGPMECIVQPDGSVIYTGFTIPPTPIG